MRALHQMRRNSAHRLAGLVALLPLLLDTDPESARPRFSEALGLTLRPPSPV